MSNTFFVKVLVLHDFVGIYTRASNIRIILEIYLLPFVPFYKYKGIFLYCLIIVCKGHYIP